MIKLIRFSSMHVTTYYAPVGGFLLELRARTTHCTCELWLVRWRLCKCNVVFMCFVCVRLSDNTISDGRA